MLELFSVFWLVLAIVLGVIEAVTFQMVAIWFCLGALAAIIPSVLGANIWVQFTVFLVVSVAALIGTRPFVKKVLKLRQVHTNADSLIGQVGVVVVDSVDGEITSGRVMVSSQEWAACTEDGMELRKGDRVLVKKIDVTVSSDQRQKNRDPTGCGCDLLFAILVLGHSLKSGDSYAEKLHNDGSCNVGVDSKCKQCSVSKRITGQYVEILENGTLRCCHIKAECV